jgi:hypothetical protein
MVSLDGVTYRIERLAPKTYAVVRVSDDLDVGTFKTAPELRVFAEGIEPALLEMIARTAVKSARTSWVGHPVPDTIPPPPVEAASTAETADEPVGQRRRWVPA